MDSRTPILITGGGGLLANAFSTVLQVRGYECISLPRTRCDIASPESVRRNLSQFHPRLIINCAAYTNQGRCEFESDRAKSVNAEAVALLAAESERYDIEPQALPTSVLDDARQVLGREEPRLLIQHAPVMLIPNVLPPELCQELMDLWETENGDSGFMKQIDGKTVGIYDYNHKIRRDHFIKSGPIQSKVQSYISSRVVPSITMAFNNVEPPGRL